MSEASPKRIGRRILFSLVAFVFFLALLEVGAQTFWYFYFHRDDATVQVDVLKGYESVDFEPAPYVIYRYIPNYSSPVMTTNSLGYRGEEFEKAKEDGEYRIIVLGGSTAMGHLASSDEAVFSAVLEDRLNSTASAGDTRYRVYNMAVGSYISAQELATLQFVALDYDPDMVITFDGVNDLATRDLENPPFFKVESQLYQQLNQGRMFALFAAGAQRTLSSNSKLYSILHFLLTSRQKRQAEISNDDVASSAAFYTRNLGKLSRLAEAHDIAHLAIFQPILTPEAKKVRTEKEKVISKKYTSFNAELSDQMFETSRAVLESEGFTLHDFRGIFRDVEENIFYDHVHVNDEGNRLIAEAMVKLVRTHLGIGNDVRSPALPEI